MTTGQKVFNTCKVKIGSQYVPRNVPHMDRDALRLQKAYLDKPQIDWDGIGIVAGVAGVVLGILLVPGWVS